MLRPLDSKVSRPRRHDCLGTVPTGFEAFGQEAIPSLIQRLEAVWKVLWSKGIDREQMIARSML